MEIPMGLKPFHAIPLVQHWCNQNEQELEWLNAKQSSVLYGNVRCLFLYFLFSLFSFFFFFKFLQKWKDREEKCK